jgi:hypothetical protein
LLQQQVQEVAFRPPVDTFNLQDSGVQVYAGYAGGYTTTPVTAASKSQTQGIAILEVKGNIVPFSAARRKVVVEM